MLYNLAIIIYDIAVHLAAPFSRKPRKMMKGHWVVYELLRQQLEKDARYIWFHAASLGEFEQGRPLIEKIRAKYPDYRILLTFFSPSGYEVRKNYRGADIVCYLPFDKPRNVKKFLDLVNPCMAFFIKYEFWKNYLDELHKRRIPVYSVSSIFRRGQIFFKWYGGTYRNVLRNFDHLFVQNERSKRYLAKIGINRVTVVGDTRFDRVLQIREEAKDLPLVELFKNNTMTFVAGSSWQPDEDLFIEYFNQHPEVKLIIAPHVIDENHLVEIIRKLKRPYVRYTRADEKNVRKADCLIIDCFVKVVILGQDPYHEPGQYYGLCFSVMDGVPFPPSLVNIFKEIQNDLGKPIPRSGRLERWADQGVLLINAILTVRAHQAGSHQGKGWEEFTDAVIRRLNDEREHIVFMLWGAYAQKKGAFIDRTRHCVLTAPHPSPLSADRGFFGCKHFSKANAYFRSKGLAEIEW